jgi:hypothetical protein
MKIVISRSQKIAGTLALLPFVTGTLYFVGYHDFYPNPELFRLSLIATALLSAGVFSLFFIKFRSGSWRPAGKLDNTLKNKFLLFLLLPLAFYFYAFLHLYLIAPRIYTALFGSEQVVTDAIEARHHGYGKYKTCDYRIETEHFQALGLQLCVSRTFYHSLPDKGGVAILSITQSPAGTIVRSVAKPD